MHLKVVVFLILGSLATLQVLCLSNDIVASLRCQLLCREIYGYSQEVTQDDVCLCKTDEKVIGKNFVRLQERSQAFKLPVKVITRKKREDLMETIGDKLTEWKDKVSDLLQNRKDTFHPENLQEIVSRAKETFQDKMEELKSTHNTVSDFFTNLQDKHEDSNLKATLEDAQQKVKEKLEELTDPEVVKSLWQEGQNKLAEIKSKSDQNKEAVLGQIRGKFGGANLKLPDPYHSNQLTELVENFRRNRIGSELSKPDLLKPFESLTEQLMENLEKTRSASLFNRQAEPLFDLRPRLLGSLMKKKQSEEVDDASKTIKSRLMEVDKETNDNPDEADSVKKSLDAEEEREVQNDIVVQPEELYAASFDEEESER